jgi:hypothetical protein
MPLKLNWMRGKNIGIAFIFLGIMGLLQVIFVAIAQYGMQIGSLYVVVLIPIGVILACFYSIIVIFESSTSMSKFREKRVFIKKKKKNTSKAKKKVNIDIDWTYLRPILIVSVTFSAIFGIMYAILYTLIDDIAVVYIICMNAGAIGSLMVASYYENIIGKKTR